MPGSTCGLGRSDTMGSVSGDTFSQQLLCNWQPLRLHKLTGSTPIFSNKRHDPVATTSAPEATMSNIAVQMQLQAHESGHVDANVWVCRHVCGQVLIFVMERRREYRRNALCEYSKTSKKN